VIHSWRGTVRKSHLSNARGWAVKPKSHANMEMDTAVKDCVKRGTGMDDGTVVMREMR
jgi:hypothetical protein